MAGNVIEKLRCPILSIVGGQDQQYQWLNQKAFFGTNAEHLLEVIPDAHRLCSEDGDIEIVGRTMTNWFLVHLLHKAAP